MPKCKNCRRAFEAYSIVSESIPVIGRKPLEVIKLNCPLCGANHHILSASHDYAGGNYEMSVAAAGKG